MNLWQPTASLKNLQLRAEIIHNIRAFFATRKILEVETPLLAQATVTDPHLQSFKTSYQQPGIAQDKTFYLQTSPEFAMKRLLAAGSGPIYQISKAFRNNGELGRFHNPEFTLLEWYRPGFDHFDLMNEMEELLTTVLNTPAAERLSYAELFLRYLELDPHQTSTEQLRACATTLLPNIFEDQSRNFYLDLLMTHVIEPQLAPQPQPIFVYDFPASQAALARLSPNNPAVAERFEVYIHGIELANGYHELNNAEEQQQRFLADLQQRQKLACTDALPIDHYLISALQHGMPDCAGVALGIDRLIMIAAQAESLAEVISFPLDRA